MQCTPAGSDLQCSVTYEEMGYCANPTPRDFTNSARWISSDASVATFRVPGSLKVIASGQIQVYAQSLANQYIVSETQAFVVAPGQAPERLANIGVGVQDANTKRFIQGATVELEPSRGQSQTCQTNQNGQCQFWSYAVQTTLRASSSGYSPAEVSVTPLTTCYCSGTLLGLSPLPQ